MSPLLEGFITRTDLASQLGTCERTIARYENAPDGLPVTTIGGKKYYRLAAVMAWIAARERRPNPRRSRVAS